MTRYFYLHGFASGPESAKAKYLRGCFQRLGLELICPDLNEPDFSSLTFSRQVAQVEAQLTDEPTIVIGSSLGGLTAAWLGQRNPQIQKLVLLAPAFEFLAQWLPRMDDSALAQWQQAGFRPVYHWRDRDFRPLHWQFVEDLHRWRDQDLQRSLPTLILHGTADEVIDFAASERFAVQRPWVTLQALTSDHALGNVSSQIWRACRQFAELSVCDRGALSEKSIPGNRLS
ncbi:YqiA/YcfP family alpha/beta fold hydrolase [Synechococcus elongatus]|uniref:YqiA/YcfP family alpha/beta fold hydrolase n=1 Tax=Synechococcus elongatus TaxID=32046 RepID=UPI000F7EB8B8|nr:YqiA/YcfP family alpha/beta fold hydrolase [Synechococcus elongatus]